MTKATTVERFVRGIRHRSGVLAPPIHRETCRYIQGQTVVTVSVEAIKRRGFTRQGFCKTCLPGGYHEAVQ